MSEHSRQLGWVCGRKWGALCQLRLLSRVLLYLLRCISAQLFPLSAAARQPEGDQEFSPLLLLGCMFLPGGNKTGQISNKQSEFVHYMLLTAFNTTGRTSRRADFVLINSFFRGFILVLNLIDLKKKNKNKT